MTTTAVDRKKAMYCLSPYKGSPFRDHCYYSGIRLLMLTGKFGNDLLRLTNKNKVTGYQLIEEVNMYLLIRMLEGEAGKDTFYSALVELCKKVKNEPIHLTRVW